MFNLLAFFVLMTSIWLFYLLKVALETGLSQRMMTAGPLHTETQANNAVSERTTGL